jgi:hypothetical protein
MTSAKFPIHGNLLGFDFDQSKVDPQLVNKLATMTFKCKAIIDNKGLINQNNDLFHDTPGALVISGL